MDTDKVKLESDVEKTSAAFGPDDDKTGVKKILSMFSNLWKSGYAAKGGLVAVALVALLLVWQIFGGGSGSANDNSGKDNAVLLQGVQLWANGPFWAECNIGASKPEELGYYFCWGDTVGCKRNAANDGWVSVADGSAFEFNKGNCQTYNLDSSDLLSSGVDLLGNFDAAFDAATVHLGSPWKVPTANDFDQLMKRCNVSWTSLNGVNGCLVTGKGAYASRSIFLPAAGRGNGSSFRDLGVRGFYWSSAPHTDHSDTAWFLRLGSSDVQRLHVERYLGQSIRPVR